MPVNPFSVAAQQGVGTRHPHQRLAPKYAAGELPPLSTSDVGLSGLDMDALMGMGSKWVICRWRISSGP